MYATPQNVPTNNHQVKDQNTITVVGIPSVSIQNNRLLVGSSQSSSTRSYTPLRELGDGTFGTVWLCDWHGTLPPNTPLSPMQCGKGARPEWAGKRLVAVKRMKKEWNGGWDECKKLKELESLRAIPFHPNIIPLYDFFLLPASKELYFVFESMEGNLYQLIRARKGRPLAGGLVSSIFLQITSGLHHIHASGYFHRDMKPENVLVTTTGLHDYQPVSPYCSVQSDVVTIIKLADFGLARETKSKPPYTEYVSTRWYRAPEVLLLSRDYSNPVDMWALGTIMAELVNLRPLFPGSTQIDQVARICEVLGDPSGEYGLGRNSKPIGGGKWSRGIRMAKAVGFAFPKTCPRDFYALFDPIVPITLVECIIDLLRYDPDLRLTSEQCLYHPYLRDTLPLNNVPLPAGYALPAPLSNIPSSNSTPLNSIASRQLPPSHSNTSNSLHGIPNASLSHRTAFNPVNGQVHHDPGTYRYPSDSSVNTEVNNGDYAMESPAIEEPHDHIMEPVRPPPPLSPYDVAPPSGNIKLKIFGRWTKGKFGVGDKNGSQGLSVVEEMPTASASNSTPSLKRTQSNSTDSRSIQDPSPDEFKSNRKMAEKLRKEAEVERRKLAEKTQREQARAVMQKRQMLAKATTDELEYTGPLNGYTEPPGQGRLSVDTHQKGKQAATGPIRGNYGTGGGYLTVANAAAGRFNSSRDGHAGDWRWDHERMSKRRRELDHDEVSVSSSDVQSVGHISTISFATVDSDPGPARLRHRSSAYGGISRMTSASSLRTSFDDFSGSVRSSNSFSLENQLANDFRLRASVDPVSGSVSPPPMQSLTLSNSPSAWPSSPQLAASAGDSLHTRRNMQQPYISLPHPKPPNGNPRGPHSPFSENGNIAPKSAINPIFRVPALPLEGSPQTHLPPFSHLEAVAEGEYPPLSPMSFVNPDEDD